MLASLVLALFPHALVVTRPAAVLSATAHNSDCSRGVFPHAARMPPCAAVLSSGSSWSPVEEPVTWTSRLRRAYGEYAARCDEDACAIEGPLTRFASVPWRRLRSLFPKPRPLSQLSLCEGGVIKVRREKRATGGVDRVMFFEADQDAPDSCGVSGIDLM